MFKMIITREHTDFNPVPTCGQGFCHVHIPDGKYVLEVPLR